MQCGQMARLHCLCLADAVNQRELVCSLPETTAIISQGDMGALWDAGSTWGNTASTQTQCSQWRELRGQVL